jgi:hypothetical protein
MRAIDADALKEDLTRFYDNEVTARKLIDEQPTIQPEITHEQAVEYLQSTGWMREHDLQMMLDGVHRLTVQPEIVRCKDCKHWKDSDGVFRRGTGAESKCPLNLHQVYEGTFFCGLAERRDVTT